MINELLVAATAWSLESILQDRDVPYEFRDDEEYQYFLKVWDKARGADKKLADRQARPAMKRITSKEPYIFLKGCDPLRIRFNYLERELEEDSFGEILIERPEFDWHISISVKSDANVLSSMKVADRSPQTRADNFVSRFNEIDDFGERIFHVPCSNEYFMDMNEILQSFEPYDTETWHELLREDEFLYGKLIGPMLRAIGNELPRICKYHPEAPQRMLDFFYGKYDYYFIKPIPELEITRIGCVNSHAGLGCMPNNSNHTIQPVRFPTELLDVRMATGKYGEISRDTIQFTFDGGWSVCMKLSIDEKHIEDRNFLINIYLPVTPFGSYRDQVPWSEK